MTSLLEKLYELLVAWYAALVPWYVLGDDMLGLVRRVGVYHRDLGPGWNWKIPILEEVQECSGAIESAALREQTITTLDGHTVTLAGVIGYHVVDARRYILGCGEFASVLNDLGCGVIGRVGPTLTCEQIMAPKAERRFRAVMRTRAAKWGIAVDSFGFADRVRAPAIRLMGRVS